MRNHWPQRYMNLACEIAKWSDDPKFKVACLIVSTDFRQIYSTGFNGNASGLSNDRDSLESGQSGYIHAEENALILCNIPRYVPKLVFCTLLPCKMCAKKLVQLGGIQTVYYKEDYPDFEVREIFKITGIELVKLGF